MAHRRRIKVARASAGKAPNASGHANAGEEARDAESLATTFSVEGEVVEVLDGFGLAHVRAPDGTLYGLNRDTPGIRFADLREGKRVRVEVARKFSCVLHAQLIE